MKEITRNPSEIPGVRKGFPPKGVPIWHAANIRAESLRATLPFEAADLYLIAQEESDYLELPVLLPPEWDARLRHPFWIPRYEKISGAVYTMRWSQPDLGPQIQIKEADDKIHLVSGKQKFVVLGGNRLRWFLANKRLAQSWRISQIVPQEVWAGVEAAMRQQDEVARDYGKDVGVEVEQVESLMREIDELNDFLRQPEITREAFAKIAERIEGVLVSQGLANASDPIKQTVVAKLEAVSPYDRLGRLNPTAARVRLRSAFYRLVEREVATGLIRDKSTRVFSFLLVEREMTRMALGDAKRLLKNTALQHPIFTGSTYLDDPNKIPSDLITAFRKTLKNVSENLLSRARVAPYLIPASIAKVFLVGPSDKKSLTKILKVGEVQRVLDTPSVDLLLRQRKPVEALTTLNYAYDVLESVLSDPDHQAYRF